MWFTDAAVAAWTAEPRTTRGGQSRYSPLAVLTALTIRAVFHLAYRQAEGLLGSIIGLLGLGLRVPDHTTLSRRAATLDVPRPGNAGAGAGSEPMHLLVDSTGLEAVRQRRVAAREARDGDTPVVADTAPRRGRQHRPDRGLHADHQGRGRRLPSRSLARLGRGRGSVVHRRRRLRPGPRLRRCHPAPSRRGRDRPAARERRAERGGRERTNTAGQPPPAHCPARAHEVAERVWIQQACPGRSHHEQVEAGDRRWAKPVKVPGAQHVEYRWRVRAHVDDRRATEVAVA